MEKVNYYEELNLDESFSVEEIQEELSRLEKLWNNRLITSPEKATAMLNLIAEAFEVFKDESTKKEYDSELSKEDQDTSPEDSANYERQGKFITFYLQAMNFMKSDEYDLALKATENALANIDGSNIPEDFYAFAAGVFFSNSRYSEALNAVNNAILLNSSDCSLYLQKGSIIMGEGEIKGERDKNNINKAARCYEKAIELSRENGNKDVEGRSLGAYSHCLLLLASNSSELQIAKQTAELALQVGDSSDYAQEVLKEINSILNKAEKSNRINDYKNKLLNGTIVSKQIYRVKALRIPSFKTVMQEGETMGTLFFQSVAEGVSKCGVYLKGNGVNEVIGGMYRKFAQEGDYSEFKYKGFLCYMVPGAYGLSLVPTDKAIQIYMTADNYFYVCFGVSSISRDYTNNEVALEILNQAIKNNIVSEDELIEPVDSVSTNNKSREEIEQERQMKIDRDYEGLVYMFGCCDSESDFSAVMHRFEALSGYKDSAEYISRCRSSITALQYKNLVAEYDSFASSNKLDYNSIDEIESISRQFEKLGNYEKAPDYVNACKTLLSRIDEEEYQYAIQQYNSAVTKLKNNEETDFKSVKSLFLKLDDYKESSKYLDSIEKCIVEQQYRSAVEKAKTCKTKTDFQELVSLLAPIEDYKKAKEIIEASKQFIKRLDSIEAKSIANDISNDSELKQLFEAIKRIDRISNNKQASEKIIQVTKDLKTAEEEINSLKQQSSSLGVFDLIKRKEIEDKILNAKKTIVSLTQSADYSLKELGYDSIESFNRDYENCKTIIKKVRYSGSKNTAHKYYFEDGILYIDTDEAVLKVIEKDYPDITALLSTIGYKAANKVEVSEIKAENGISDEDAKGFYNSEKVPYGNFKHKKAICVFGHNGHGKTTLMKAISKISFENGQYVVFNSGKSTFPYPNLVFETNSFRYRLVECASSVDDFRDAFRSTHTRANGAIFVISTIEGPMAQTRIHLELAKTMGISRIVIFMNMTDLTTDASLIELVELEIRETIAEYGFDRNSTIIKGSALNALKNDSDSVNTITELLDAADNVF